MIMKTLENTKFYQANCDSNCNPRYILHFPSFLTDEEFASIDVLEAYEIARKRANKCGFKVYRGRDFGGGFISQGSINAPSDIKRDLDKINNILNNLNN